MNKFALTLLTLSLSMASASVFAKPEAAQGINTLSVISVTVSDSAAIDPHAPLQVAKGLSNNGGGEGGR